MYKSNRCQRLVNRRKFLYMAGAAVTETIVTTCDSSRLKAGEKVKLVYQDWRTDWFPRMVEEMQEQFYGFNV